MPRQSLPLAGRGPQWIASRVNEAENHAHVLCYRMHIRPISSGDQPSMAPTSLGTRRLLSSSPGRAAAYRLWTLAQIPSALPGWLSHNVVL